MRNLENALGRNLVISPLRDCAGGDAKRTSERRSPAAFPVEIFAKLIHGAFIVPLQPVRKDNFSTTVLLPTERGVHQSRETNETGGSYG